MKLQDKRTTLSFQLKEEGDPPVDFFPPFLEAELLIVFHSSSNLVILLGSGSVGTQWEYQWRLPPSCLPPWVALCFSGCGRPWGPVSLQTCCHLTWSPTKPSRSVFVKRMISSRVVLRTNNSVSRHWAGYSPSCSSSSPRGAARGPSPPSHHTLGDTAACCTGRRLWPHVTCELGEVFISPRVTLS